MAPDKQNNTTPSKPFTPTLSTSFRTTKSPLTPKLAGHILPHTPHKSPLGDLPYLSQKPETFPPVSRILNPNITPRSGPRKLKACGTSSPAESSPNALYGSHPVSSTLSSGSLGGDTRVLEKTCKSQTRSTKAKGTTDDIPNYTWPSHPSSPSGSSTGSPVFFQADDARSSASSYDHDVRSTSRAEQTSTTTFLYAHRIAEEDIQRADSQATAPASRRPPISQPALPAKSSEPVVSARLRSAQLRVSPPKSPPSSGRDWQWTNLHPPSRQNAVLVQDFRLPRNPEPAVPSGDIPKRSPHRKSSSLDSFQQAKRQRQDITINPVAVLIPSPSDSISEAQPTPEITQKAITDGLTLPGDVPLSSPHVRCLTGGEGPHFCHHQTMDEVAANARRERKVLDLEISNSSLLAINRALEREVRKQNAELRRFRRLSRRGRLSLAPSLRSVSGDGPSVLSELDNTPSDPSPSHSDDESSNTSDSESSLSNGDRVPSNSACERDSQRPSRDERRFLRDLSKHQRILVDSQKMDQSIKRCLSWTENLIREAKRALEYHVRISDIDIRGRVLVPDEIEGETEGRHRLLSPAEDQPPPEEVQICQTIQMNDSDEVPLDQADPFCQGDILFHTL